MNFSPYHSLAQALPGSGLHLAGGKYQGGLQQGQVLGMLGPDTVHYITGAQPQPQIITLPITVSGKPDSDQEPQTIQIQVVNPNTAAAATPGHKFVMPIQIQGFPQGAATVLTLAYNQAAPGEPLQLHLQPQIAESNNNQQVDEKVESDNDDKATQTMKEERIDLSEEEDINADPDIDDGQSSWSPPSMQLSLQHFLRFSADTIRREQALQMNSPLSEPPCIAEDDSDAKAAPKKRKRSGKKKTPRPRKPRPGQVHIATALDGTTLFCCPECHMAYPDKELLEQHLVGHKIERRFICDTCGAGLKRKEHLERHKLGHNPERPFICPICQKGFKRKEHLNLHSVIHSGSKSEVCMECGKGFYRKDHLRKHAKSHVTKKMKEAAQAQAHTIVEAQQRAQTTQVQVQIPNMPGLSVIPITTSVPTLNVKMEDEDDEEVEDEDGMLEDDEFISTDGLDVGTSSPGN